MYEMQQPDKICRYWSIIENSFPAGRINVILIDEDLEISFW